MALAGTFPRALGKRLGHATPAIMFVATVASAIWRRMAPATRRPVLLQQPVDIHFVMRPDKDQAIGNRRKGKLECQSRLVAGLVLV